MSIFSYEFEVITVIPPAKMFKACILDGENLIPKAMMSLVASRRLPLNKEASHYMVEKVEALDKDKLVYSYSVIEGSVFINKMEKIAYETKLEPSSAGGSISKISCKYYTIGDFEITEGLKAGKEKALQILKAVDAYVLANPRH
ncbi:major strawberry allergen Fra a 1.05-like [Gossypium hirsutum]|uniref:Major strawberry allergen Fra a 1.05-like n=1 Tax=Gossypium hirsutum TaxID=3635 RepID=A0A1U8M5R5_GOSHI|nr:major strawberry allergen Fra a 1.05-like [Gossypium hirsutum]